MAQPADHVEKFLSHPILWGVTALIAIALALSGRLSVTAATWFVWAAWGMAIFGTYRAVVYFGIDILLRLLITATIALGLSVAAILGNRWIRAGNPAFVAKDKPPQNATTNETGRTGNSNHVAPKQNPPVPPLAVSPDDELTALGWNLSSDPQYGKRFTFNSYQDQLPDMHKSAQYFRALHQPFTVFIGAARSISRLSELHDVTNLASLIIQSVGLNDIKELKDFTGITSLELDGVTADLGPISSLTQLQKFSLTQTSWQDISPIASLKNLKEVSLFQSGVLDLSPLSGMKHLESLNLFGTAISDLSALSSDVSLTKLQISATQAPEVYRVASSLTDLMIADYSPIDLRSVGQLSKLRKLDIMAGGDAPLDLKPLGSLSQLRELFITGTGKTMTDFNGMMQVHNPSSLGDLTGLQRLMLARLVIYDISFVARLHNLTDIMLNWLPIPDISAVGQLKSLTSVQLVGLQIVDIRPLLELPDLKKVTIQRTPAQYDVITELKHHGVKFVEH